MCNTHSQSRPVNKMRRASAKAWYTRPNRFTHETNPIPPTTLPEGVQSFCPYPAKVHSSRKGESWSKRSVSLSRARSWPLERWRCWLLAPPWWMTSWVFLFKSSTVARFSSLLARTASSMEMGGSSITGNLRAGWAFWTCWCIVLDREPAIVGLMNRKFWKKRESWRESDKMMDTKVKGNNEINLQLLTMQAGRNVSKDES